MPSNSKLIVHFDTSIVRLYALENGTLTELKEQSISLKDDSSFGTMFEKVDTFLGCLRNFNSTIDNECVRLYGTGVFQTLCQFDRIELINRVFINHGLYFNVIPSDLEKFYLEHSNGTQNLIHGMLSQMFRSVVVCGSFQQSLAYIDNVVSVLREHHIEVLSPRSTKVRPETLGTNFILFEYQEDLKNERDTWRYKYEHVEKFKQADAVIVCNPGGGIGKGTMFEFGCMVSIPKRIILTERPTNLSILFPYEIGLDLLHR